MIRTFQVFLFLVMLPLAVGCGVRLPVAPPRGEPVAEYSHHEVVLEKRSLEIVSVRALYRGTLTVNGRRSAGRYVLAFSAPFRARIEVLPNAIGTALLLGVFDSQGGTVIDNTQGVEFEVSKPQIPLVEGGKEYDLQILLPLFFGRVTTGLIPSSFTQDPSRVQVEYRHEGILVAIDPSNSLVKNAYFLTPDAVRIQAEIGLEDYKSVQGVEVPHRILLQEYQSEASAEFLLQSVTLNRPIPDDIFIIK